MALVRPSLELGSWLRFGEWRTRYALNAYLPTSQFGDERLSQLTQQAELNFNSHLTSRLDLILREEFSPQTADLAKPTAQISNIKEQNFVSLQLQYRLPLSLRTESRFSLQASRTDIFGFDSDHNGLRAEWDLTREVNARFIAANRLRLEAILYEANRLQDAIIYSWDVRAEYELLPRLKIIVPIGLQYLEQADSGGHLAMSADVQLLGEIDARSTIQSSYRRGFTVDAVGNNYESWEAAMVYALQVTARSKVELAATYFNFNLASQNSNDDATIDMALHLLYELTSSMQLISHLRLFMNRGDYAANDLDTNQVYLGINYVFN